MVKHPWSLLEISLSDFRRLATLDMITYLLGLNNSESLHIFMGPRLKPMKAKPATVDHQKYLMLFKVFVNNIFLTTMNVCL